MPIELSQGFRFGAFTAEPLKGSVAADDGQPCHLAPKAMDVLVRLAEAAPKPVTREDLITAVWGERYVSDEVLTHAIKELRHALGDSPTKPKYIKTIPKRGYRLLRKARPIVDPAPALERRKRRYLVIAASLVLVFVACGWFVVNLARNAGPIEAPSEADEVTVSGITVTPSPRIAVLPFADLSPGGDQEYFADGITEEILNLLGQIESLKVIARQSSFFFKGQNVDIPTIAAKLDVSYVVEGSVRRSGDRVRITAQLIDATDSSHLWSEAYDRDYSAENLIEIQCEIARAITGQLRVTLTGDDEARLARVPTQITEAYAAYLLGRERLRDRRIDLLKDAVDQFALAVELDANFAGAYSGLVDACILYISHNGGHQYERCPPEPEGLLKLAQKAVDLDPELGEAWVSLAASLEASAPREGSQRLEQFDEAKSAYERGLELNPNQSQGYLWYAHNLAAQFRLTNEPGIWKAVHARGFQSVIAKGLEADPLSITLHTAASAYPASAQTPEEAMSHVRRIVEIAPDSPLGLNRLAEYSWSLEGRADEAIRWAHRAAQVDPGQARSAYLSATAYSALGDFDMALAYLDKADRLVADVRPRSLLTRGLNQLHAGRIEEAVETLERVQDAVPRWMHYKLNALTSLDLAAGDYDKALSRYESQRDSCLEPKRTGWDQNCAAGAFARTLQATGDSANAIRLCRSFEHDAGLLPTEFGDVRDLFLIGSSGRAFLYAGDLAICGRQDEALELIEKAVNLGFRGHAMAFGDWRFAAFHDIRLDAIRDHSRFRAAMAIIEADMAQQLKNVRAMQRRGEIPTLEELNAEVAAE